MPNRVGLVQGSVSVSTIRPSDDRLARLLDLWRANSATLGFLPEGAFLEHARKGYLLGAFTGSDELVGYLLYRVTKAVAVIIHLCVAESFRGGGVARRLVDALRVATADCIGIRASCRADFVANDMWPHLSFSVVAERPAKEEGRTLKSWWCDYGTPDLFSSEKRTGPIAVLDTNVFSDLFDSTREESQESQGLLAGWFQDAVQLAVVPELYNEIDRRRKIQERSRARRYAGRFLLLRPPLADLDSWKRRLAVLLEPVKSRSDASDRRQLAGAIAGGARFFVTRDGKVLARASKVFEESGIQMVRPAEIISMSDEEINAATYQPARLAGVRLTLRRVRADEIPKLAVEFLAYKSGERKAALLKGLRDAAASPGSAELWSIASERNEAVALLLLRHNVPETLYVDLLRIS